MGISYNRRTLGLYNNGLAQTGTNEDQSTVKLYSAGSPSALSGDFCFAVGSPSVFGLGWLSDEFIPVDTSKTYIHACSMRTVENNYLGNPGSGHIGFSPYDDQKRFIDLRQCGGLGNTTLARDANIGDSYVFITSNTSWTTGAAANHQCHIMLYPATHPDFSVAYEYTRIGFGDQSIYFDPEATKLTGSPPSFRLTLVLSDLSTPTTFPNVGHSTPSGTPVMNGKAGGTYCYCHSNPNYPIGEWTTYITTKFTGETRNSSQPFRYGTKYIKFLNLRNFNFRTQTGSPAGTGSSSRYLIDNIMVVEVPPGKTYPDKLFSTKDTHE